MTRRLLVTVLVLVLVSTGTHNTAITLLTAGMLGVWLRRAQGGQAGPGSGKTSASSSPRSVSRSRAALPARARPSRAWYARSPLPPVACQVCGHHARLAHRCWLYPVALPDGGEGLADGRSVLRWRCQHVHGDRDGQACSAAHVRAHQTGECRCVEFLPWAPKADGYLAASRANATVYLAVHDGLQAVKVGVAAGGERLVQHQEHGWRIAAVHPKIARQDAERIESSLLAEWRRAGVPFGLVKEQMPQGGYTETAPLARVGEADAVRTLQDLVEGRAPAPVVSVQQLGLTASLVAPWPLPVALEPAVDRWSDGQEMTVEQVDVRALCLIGAGEWAVTGQAVLVPQPTDQDGVSWARVVLDQVVVGMLAVPAGFSGQLRERWSAGCAVSALVRAVVAPSGVSVSVSVAPAMLREI